MHFNLLSLSEKSFEEMCQALLREEFQRFEPYSAPDLGMDGYDADSGTIFQAYFPEREPRRDKVAADLEKARSQPCQRWVLLLPKNPTPTFHRWLTGDQQARCSFPLEIWGATEIKKLMRKHPDVPKAYFRTHADDVMDMLVKGKKPAPGDAAPGGEISQEQAEELRRSMEDAAKDEAGRRRRKPKNTDYQREYGEFKKHFELSYYARLPMERFAEARRYLEVKTFARRNAETRRDERLRCIKGVKAIQRKLRMPESRYRQTLLQLTGKDSLAVMDNDELRKVFKHFQQLQGEAEAAG